MGIPKQPTCSCMECKSYGLVYSSLINVYRCVECKTQVQARYVEDIILAYGVYRSSNPPTLIPNYNAIICLSCLRKGGLHFKGTIVDSVNCEKCRFDIPIYYLHDAMVTAYRTRLLEQTYNTAYAVFGGK